METSAWHCRLIATPVAMAIAMVTALIGIKNLGRRSQPFLKLADVHRQGVASPGEAIS